MILWTNREIDFNSQQDILEFQVVGVVERSKYMLVEVEKFYTGVDFGLW